MIEIEQLRELIAESETAGDYFEHLATRVKNYRTSTVEQVMRTIGHGRRDVVDLFKSMESVGLGTFVVGRRTGVSRFEWSVGMIDAAHAAFGESETVETIDESELEDEEEGDASASGFTLHTFALRRNGKQISFELPTDLTAAEAERLSKFILTLPIAD